MVVYIIVMTFKKKEETQMSHNFGGETVVVWGAFAFTGKLPMTWIRTNVNSQDYISS